MKKQNLFKERGQSLVIIALAAVGLFAFTALAVDGGMVFSDRRHSQNASDTAVLAAALARARASANWEQTGLDRAEVNGYSNATGSIVEVYLCSDANATCTNLAPGTEGQYVQVRITSTVKLFFARIIGWQEVTNHTDAIARASIPEVTPWFDGNALVSTMEGCKADEGYNHDPFTVSGDSGTTIINSGIFVNSDCDQPPAFDQGGSSSVTTDQGVCVVGSADYTNVSPPPSEGPGEGCTQVDSSMYVLPNPACSQNGEIIEVSSGNYEAWPGTYNGSFPSDALPNGSPAGTLKLHKGIYCLHDGMDFQSTWNVTTNLNGNTDVNGEDIHDSDSEGVFFYVQDGDVTFNGTSDINIHAISSLADNFPEAFLNYLIYVPPSNSATIKITGNDGSSFTGTILAPSSHIVLNGGSGTVGLDSQIIGYSIAIAGNGTLDITFNQANNAVAITNPGIELTE